VVKSRLIALAAIEGTARSAEFCYCTDFGGRDADAVTECAAGRVATVLD
jgi:hypothetical protein